MVLKTKIKKISYETNSFHKHSSFTAEVIHLDSNYKLIECVEYNSISDFLRSAPIGFFNLTKKCFGDSYSLSISDDVLNNSAFTTIIGRCILFALTLHVKDSSLSPDDFERLSYSINYNFSDAMSHDFKFEDLCNMSNDELLKALKIEGFKYGQG